MGTSRAKWEREKCKDPPKSLLSNLEDCKPMKLLTKLMADIINLLAKVRIKTGLSEKRR